MWVDIVKVLSWMLVWFFGVSFAYFLIQTPIFKENLWPKCRRYHLVILIGIALLVRLVPAFLLPVGAGHDIQSYRLVADALLAGEDVYTSAAVGRHPYFPLFMYVIGASLYLSLHTFIPFVTWVKLVPIVCDVVITGVIFISAQKMGKSKDFSAFLALLFALNPISVLVSAYHGQFDSIPILLLLLAWYFWHFKRDVTVSSVFLGFAVLVKTWPIVFLPIIFFRLPIWKDKFKYVMIVFAIPILFTMAYVLWFSSDPEPMLRRALTHIGPTGYWGPGSIFAVASCVDEGFQTGLDVLKEINRWLVISVAVFSLWATRKNSTLDALLTILLCILAVNMGMGMQWLLWIVPFAILAFDIRWLNIYSFAGIIFLGVHLFGYHLYPWASEFLNPVTADVVFRLTPLLAWIVVLLWAASRLYRSFQKPVTPVS